MSVAPNTNIVSKVIKSFSEFVNCLIKKRSKIAQKRDVKLDFQLMLINNSERKFIPTNRNLY